MTALPVIDNHNDLTEIGTLKHDEIDGLFLSGTVPAGLTVEVPFISASNHFVSHNYFDSDVTFKGTLNVYGNIMSFGTASHIEMSTLEVDSAVIFLGGGSSEETVTGDRGLVFNMQGQNDPSFFWDNSSEEFRLARVDTTLITTGSAGVDIFPSPTTSSYIAFHAGSLISEGDIFATGTATVTDLTASANISANSIVSVYGTINQLTASLSIATFFTSSYSQITEINSDTVTALTASVADKFVLRNMFALGGTIPYLTASAGLSITQDQATGQLTFSPNIVDRRKFVQEISTDISAGANVTVSGLDFSSLSFEDDRFDLFVNGVLQVHGSASDFTVTPNGIEFSFDLESDDTVTAIILD